MYLLVLAIHLRTRWWELDFGPYYCWAYALRTGLDPYTVDLILLAKKLGLSTGAFRANYPATFILCFEPLTLLSPQNAYWVWTGFNFLLLPAALAVLLARRGIRPRESMVLAALGVFYQPISENFFWAQLQIVLLLLLALNFRLACAGKDAMAGLALSIAILLKAFPAILLFHFVLARRIRVVAWTLVGTAAGWSLTLLIVGRRAWGFLRPSTTTPEVWWNAGLSVSATISRIFSAVLHEPLVPGANLARIAITTAVVTWLLALGVRATIHSTRVGRGDAGYAIWVVLTVFIFPITWIDHLVLLLIPFSQIAIAAYEGDAIGSAPALALASYLVAEVMLPLFWIYWLTWFVPLLSISAAVAQASGVLAFCAAYRLGSEGRARIPIVCP
jgi:alpha-1,2-mannosyltransferase